MVSNPRRPCFHSTINRHRGSKHFRSICF